MCRSGLDLRGEGGLHILPLAFLCIFLQLLLAAATVVDNARIVPSASNGKVSATMAIWSDLSLSAGTLVPAFDPIVFYYTISLNNSYSRFLSTSKCHWI
ncbi:hypothetical protein GOP47_0030783, partial [Adiantum capillus-veneris]